jgi:hypothetical protein
MDAEVYLVMKVACLKAEANLDCPDCPDIITDNVSAV